MGKELDGEKKRIRTNIIMSRVTDPFTELPLDVVNLIFHRMNLTARLRARAVCRAWRDLHLPPVDLHQERPWLLLHDPQTSPESFDLLEFSSSTSADKSPVHHRRPIPYCYRGPHACPVVAGCVGHVLILAHLQHTLEFLLDPFAGKFRSLPQWSLANCCEPPTPYIHQAKLSCPPTDQALDEADCECKLALLTKGPTQRNYEIKVCCVDGLYVCWVTLWNPTGVEIMDMIFHDGKLYAIDGEGVILAADELPNSNERPVVSNPPLTQYVVVDHTPPPPLRHPHFHLPNYYLVESSGELLVICRDMYRSDKHIERWGEVAFKVFKLDHASYKLVRVNDLGDRMVFLGRGSSMSYVASPSPPPAGRGFFIKNCIYFVWLPKIGRFHLEEEKPNEYLDIDFKGNYPFFDPIWIAPFLNPFKLHYR